MRNSNIEKIFSRILKEEIEKKSKEMSSNFGEWTEIDTNEELHGNQKKLDVAKPKGKLTADDFKKLRSRKKEEVDEMDYRTPKMIGSFDDEDGWYDDMDYRVSGDVFSDYDEEEFDDFDDFDNKYGKEQMWFKGRDGKKFFDLYKDKHQKPLKVRKPKSFDESETEEGNAFTGALSRAKKEGEHSFKVDGKKYDVKENSNTLKLSENELIDLIESLVKKQLNEVSDLDGMNKKSPEGLKKTQKVQRETKKENDEYAKEVVEKMKNYLKGGSNASYEMNPDYFPKGNGELKKMDKKAYTASGAVEEYIENFARAAGLEELVYGEIEPHEDWVKDNIKGSVRTGNDEKWGNAVETELGEKLFQKSQKKPYSTEKRKGSYKRQPQPIDKAGEHDGKKSIDDMFAKLESKEDKKSKIVSEEVNKIKSLYSYNAKTQ